MFGLFKRERKTPNPATPKQKADEPVICDRFAASLGISGDGLDLDEISRTLGLTPTIARPKGGHKVTWNDQWVYQAPIAKERPLDEHIMALWDAIRPQISYLRELKKKHQVEIVCSYIGCYFRGTFKVDHRCLGLFEELDIPFRIAVNISIANMIPPTKAQVDAKAASILEQTKAQVDAKVASILEHKHPPGFDKKVLGWRFGPATRQG